MRRPKFRIEQQVIVKSFRTLNNEGYDTKHLETSPSHIKSAFGCKAVVVDIEEVAGMKYLYAIQLLHRRNTKIVMSERFLKSERPDFPSIDKIKIAVNDVKHHKSIEEVKDAL
jgi:hypothetical protein